MTVSQWNDYSSRYLIAPPREFAGYSNIESFDFLESFAQMRAVAKPPRKIPLMVVSKGLPFGIPAPLGSGNRARPAQRADLPRLALTPYPARHCSQQRRMGP